METEFKVGNLYKLVGDELIVLCLGVNKIQDCFSGTLIYTPGGDGEGSVGDYSVTWTKENFELIDIELRTFMNNKELFLNHWAKEQQDFSEGNKSEAWDDNNDISNGPDEIEEEDFEKCPKCGASIEEKMSGVVCSDKCGWWFCY